jgi:predicted RNA polymerase sigma factor
MPDLTAHVDFIDDDVLRLIFLSCHPQLTPESRAALT